MGEQMMSRVGFVCTCKKCGSELIVFVSRGQGLVRCLQCKTVGDYSVFRARKYRTWEEVNTSEPKNLDG